MKRRDFLRVGSMAAGAAVAGPVRAGGAQAGGPSRQQGEVPAFELEEATIADLQKAMESGRETSRSLVEKYIGRIEALDRKGPALRQVLEVNPDALDVAARLDEERKSGRVRGPLHGIPVLVKDNVGTADRMTTTAGSLALEGSIPPEDSFVARRLRDAGAVILGKTNMSEWANFRSTRSVSGWSGRGGLGRNPYVLDRNTSGSSSGTGAAIAANYAAVGIGTETDGSIVSPSNNCCLVGIKPTVGVVSRTGIIPIAHSQDTAGPMARTVADAAALLGAMAGNDPADPVTRASAFRGRSDYTKFLHPQGLKGARIGVPREHLFGQNPHADRLVDAALAAMREAGAEIVDPVALEAGKVGDAEFEVLLYEFKADLNAYLAGLGPKAPAKSLADLIAFNDRNAGREMPWFGQEIFLMAEKKGPLTDEAYLKALATCRRLARVEGIDRVLTQHKLDALVAPTSGPPHLTDLAIGDYGPGGCSTLPAVAGYPHVTVPAGFAFGLPIGVSFFGAAFSEPTLIRLAYAYEQATKHRRPPRFLRTAELA